MAKIAIIDFSTSSLSLLVAKTEKKKINYIFNSRTHFSFSESVYEGRVLTEVEILEVLDAASAMIDLCVKQSVSKVFATASSTLQTIGESDALISLVEAKTGLKITKLDSKEEADARLFANERYNILPEVVLIDFGSIALKLYSFSDYLQTIDIGPLSISKDFVSEIVPSPREADTIKERLRDLFEEEDLPKEGRFQNAVMAGIYSREIWALYSEHFGLGKKDEMVMSYKKLKKLCKYLVKDSERAADILKNAPELVGQAVPAVLLAKELLRRFKIDNIIISSLGSKEGILKEVIHGRREMAYLNLEVDV